MILPLLEELQDLLSKSGGGGGGGHNLFVRHRSQGSLPH